MKFYSLFSLLLLLLLPGSLAMAQQAAPQNQPTSEMETKEAPAKFTSRVNLVPVTVVVRDRNGHAVGNLTKEDFRLLDNGKTQVISRFSIEKPGAPVVLEKDCITGPVATGLRAVANTLLPWKLSRNLRSPRHSQDPGECLSCTNSSGRWAGESQHGEQNQFFEPRRGGFGAQQRRRYTVRCAFAGHLLAAAREGRESCHRSVGSTRRASRARNRTDPHRGPGPRKCGGGHGRAVAGAGRQGDSLAHVRRFRQRHRPPGGAGGCPVAHGPSRPAAVSAPFHQIRDLRDGDQGHRRSGAARARRRGAMD